MHRPNAVRRNEARPGLERLEALLLPGEGVLSAITAGLAADQFSFGTQDYPPPNVSN